MRQTLTDYDEPAEDFRLQGDERAEDYPAADRSVAKIALGGLAMALFAGGLWLAYHAGSRQAAPATAGGGVPLIRADQQPTKVKPEQPGGMSIPDQNVSIYNEKEGLPSVERLLPPPEKPLPRPTPPPQAAAPAPATPPAPAAAPTPATGASGRAPEATPPTLSPPPGNPPVQREAAAPSASPATHGKPAVSRAEAANSGGPVRVQVAAVRTPDAARAEWDRLKHEYPGLLGGLPARAVRADLGDKGVFYRVQAGQFADVAEAERLCSELKRRKLECALVR